MEKKKKGGAKKWERGKRKGKCVEQGEHTFVSEKQKYFLPVKLCGVFFFKQGTFSQLFGLIFIELL